MFEFNIPAAETSDRFVGYIHAYLQYLETHIIKPKGLGFSWNNKHKFHEKQLEHPLAQTIGCSPDWNAYLPKIKQMRAPFGIHELGTSRFCGGHLHVQYNYNNVPRDVFVRFMDIVVGLAFLTVDKQAERRKFYGKAGIYRPKEYGIEYRTPSNFWLEPSFRVKGRINEMASNVFNLGRMANDEPDELSRIYSNKVPWPDVEKAINEEDTKLAADVFRYVASELPVGLYSSFHPEGTQTKRKMREVQIR